MLNYSVAELRFTVTFVGLRMKVRMESISLATELRRTLLHVCLTVSILNLPNAILPSMQKTTNVLMT